MPQLATEFSHRISERVIEEHRALAGRWLDRLHQLVSVEADEIFPSPSLLDHIPELIARIGRFLGDYDHEDIATNSAVLVKAQELGVLRQCTRDCPRE